MKKIISNLPFIMAAVIIILIAVLTSGCTEQQIAKNYGGATTIELPKGQKLVEATWKEDNLWYLTEPMDSDYVPTTRVFQESSAFGIMEGTVTFVESK